MAAADRDILQMVRSVVNGTDHDGMNTGSWFGHVLADLQLAVGNGTVVYVDWEAEGNPSAQFESSVIVATEDAFIVAQYEQEDASSTKTHAALVKSRRAIESVAVSTSLPFSDHDTPGNISVHLSWPRDSTIALPLSRSTSINDSLKTLVPSLLKDVTA